MVNIKTKVSKIVLCSNGWVSLVQFSFSVTFAATIVLFLGLLYD